MENSNQKLHELHTNIINAMRLFTYDFRCNALTGIIRNFFNLLIDTNREVAYYLADCYECIFRAIYNYYTDIVRITIPLKWVLEYICKYLPEACIIFNLAIHKYIYNLE